MWNMGRINHKYKILEKKQAGYYVHLAIATGSKWRYFKKICLLKYLPPLPPTSRGMA
jgi:hypothetical protein